MPVNFGVLNEARNVHCIAQTWCAVSNSEKFAIVSICSTCKGIKIQTLHGDAKQAWQRSSVER